MSEPVVSFIVPFRNGQEHIPRLLECFAAHARREGWELLLINDASTDHSHMVAERAFGKLGLPARLLDGAGEGPGRARNLGIEHARGRYIVFCDVDDLLEVKEIFHLCGEMERVGAELAVFNHQRLYPSGRLKLNSQTDLLNSLPPLVADLADRVQLLKNFNVCWNKIYRRTLLDKYGLRFPEGIYEDVPWSIVVLALASSILVTDKIIYTYRQHHASILRKKGVEHLSIVEQYRRALSVLAFNRVDEFFLKEVRLRAVKHVFLVGYSRSRLGLDLRGRLFRDLLLFVSEQKVAREIVFDRRLMVEQRLSLLLSNRWPLELSRIVRWFLGRG